MSGEKSGQGKGKLVQDWWYKNISQDDNKERLEKAAARGLSARLRRAAGPLPVLLEPVVQELAQSLHFRQKNADILVRLVCLLAEVREHQGSPLPKLLGGTEPVMSRARFERLVRAQGEELTTLMRRAIIMSERKCNVASLARDLIYWDDETKTRWAFDYFDPDKPREDTPDNGLGRAVE